MSSPEIVQVPERDRFTLSVDGEVIGKALYTDADGTRTFVHTEVDPAHEGNGYASRLIERAVAETRAANLRIVGQCPMVAHWLSKHPEYDEFVDPVAPQAV
jgi:predicted GNAT family acetyltransferase